MDTTNSSEKPQRRVKHGQRPTEPLADWPAEFGAAGAEQPAATSGDAPDLQQLKALALAATPGPWFTRPITDDDLYARGLAIVAENGKTLSDEDAGPGDKDATYIAAANPAVVLDLIARIERTAAPAPEVDPEKDFSDWMEKRGALGAGAVPERIFFAGHSAGRRAAVSAATKPTADAETLKRVCDLLRIGELARTPGVILTNIENLIRRESCLVAVEREFFMAPVERDDDFPDEDPGDECILNWATAPSEYVDQFRASLLATKPAAAPGVPEGFVIVPKLPTEEMIAASMAPAIYDGTTHTLARRGNLGVWSKMIAAAPAPAASTIGAAQTADQVREQALEEAALAAEAQNRVGYEWVKDSLWDNIIKRVPAAIRALKRPATTHNSEAGATQTTEGAE